jgi:pimeloyl-ACP methyl ester carboxylesterase
VDSEALDLPGFGDSPPPDDGNYSVTGHARAVIRYLDAAERGPVHLFGNSLGGAVATRVAAVRPDLVETLTLISPALPEIRAQRTAWPTALLSVPGVARLFTRLTKDWSAEQRVRGVMALCYGDPGMVTPEGFRDAVEEMERRLALPYFWDAMARSSRGLVNAYTLGGQHGLWRQAERVLAPTLLVYGGRDQLVAYRMARRAARAFRDSRLLSLPDAGHVAMMEYPETVASAFRELLAETGELTSPAGADAGS